MKIISDWKCNFSQIKTHIYNNISRSNKVSGSVGFSHQVPWKLICCIYTILFLAWENALHINGFSFSPSFWPQMGDEQGIVSSLRYKLHHIIQSDKIRNCPCFLNTNVPWCSLHGNNTAIQFNPFLPSKAAICVW